MERRRIQLVGRSTLTVSLPANWVKKVGLKKGDLVTIAPERDGSLKILQGSATAARATSNVLAINSDLCREGGLIGRLIVAGYVRGFDVIKVTSSATRSSSSSGLGSSRRPLRASRSSAQ
jgi:phosphate uptake regulator